MYKWLYYHHPLLRRPLRANDSVAKLSHLELGDLGERMAAVYLRSLGLKVLYRNYRGPKGGELDIVAREGEVLVFIEVKTRRRRGKGRPLDAVGREKQELIERGARSWLRLLGRSDMPWRFDVVEVILEEGARPDLTLVKDAF